VDDHIERLVPLLDRGDTIIEGGNSFYKDDIKRSGTLNQRGINYLDVGVSGGVWGLEEGYCLMIGGPRSVYELLAPVFKTLAPRDGYMYCGKSGAGHFVKMVHNGIEYGMMQAYGEGFHLIEASPFGDDMDYSELSHLWNQGSVIRSWLLELLENAFAEDPKLENLKGYVDDSGEGRWTVQEAVDMGVAAPVAAMSLFMRFASREQNAFSNRVLAALRREFGGHAVKGT
jgi:6-phosphogluconate dehydrogenase